MRRMLGAVLAMGMIATVASAQERGGFGAMGSPMGGHVTAVAADSVTVKTELGDAWVIAVTANTRVSKDRQPIKLSDIKVGDAVVSYGVEEADKKVMHAAVLASLTPEQAQRMAEREKEMRENLGKTMIVGKVTKMDETRLTVLRPDGVTQVAAVDENTLMRKGGGRRGGAAGGPRGGGQGAAPADAGEPITLADVQVGSTISGRGAVAGDVFLMKELRLMEPRHREGGEPQ